MATPDSDRFRAYLARELRQTRDAAEKQRRMWLDFEAVLRRMNIGDLQDLEAWARRNSRKRPPGMASAMVEPPRGPKPLAGGAAAPLEFDN